MAKTNSKSSTSAPYIFAAILLAVIYIINTFLVESIYASNTKVSKSTSETMSAINRMNSELEIVNGNVLRIVANVGDATQAADDATLNFENIRDAMSDFEEIEDMSDTAKKRYNHAKAIILTR